MDGIVSLVCRIEGSFLIYEWKNVMDALGVAVSLETVLLGTQDVVKMDGFESFYNIIHIV